MSKLSTIILAAGFTLGVLAPLSAVAADQVKITDIKVGTGPKSANGDLVLVSYTGTLKNGEVFDSNEKEGRTPFSLRLGPDAGVIKGWRIGLVGMKKGGVRKLVIPPSLAYGARGQGSIGPNETLTFTIKMLDIVKKGEGQFYDKKDLRIGKGKIAAKGSVVSIKFTGKFVNGLVFDDSSAKKPVKITIGSPEVLKAFWMGIQGMKEGGKRWLRLPPDIAFGSNGKSPMIPGDMVLIFEIELVKVISTKK